MPADRIDRNQQGIDDHRTPIVTHVELGVAKLNSVSHHEYLRCAKLVSPLVRKLSFKGKNSSGTTVSSPVLLVEPLSGPGEDSDDVYEDVMEDTLETSFDTRVNEPKQSGSVGDDESDTSSISGTGVESETIESDQDTDVNTAKFETTETADTLIKPLADYIVPITDTIQETVDVSRENTYQNIQTNPQTVDITCTNIESVIGKEVVEHNNNKTLKPESGEGDSRVTEDPAKDKLVANENTDKMSNSVKFNSVSFMNEDEVATKVEDGYLGDGMFNDYECHSPPDRRESRVTVETDLVSEFLELYESRKLELSKEAAEELDDSRDDQDGFDANQKQPDAFGINLQDNVQIVVYDEDGNAENVGSDTFEGEVLNEEDHSLDVEDFGSETVGPPKKYYKDEDDFIEELKASALQADPSLIENPQESEIEIQRTYHVSASVDHDNCSISEAAKEVVTMDVNNDIEDRGIIEENYDGAYSDDGVNGIEYGENESDESVDINDDSGIVDVTDEDVSAEEGFLMETNRSVLEVIDEETLEVEDTQLETYKSTSFLILSPSGDDNTANKTFSQSLEEAEPKPTPAAESSPQEPEENAAKFNGNNEVKENGISDEDAVRDPDVFRETRDKEEIHFAEMNNVRQKFESGVPSDKEPVIKTGSIRDEYDEGGEYESTPVQNPDVVKETDQTGEELPEIGTAKSLLNKFKTLQEEKSAQVYQREQTPPKEINKVEYTNEPAESTEQYIGKSEEGEFESVPKEHADVVKSGDRNEDVVPEKGATKNIMNKFKEIQSGTAEVKSPGKRELTPDRSGKVEYVSEPRGEKIEYEETKGDSGVFESTPKIEDGVVRSEDVGEEVLPQAGTAKSLLSKFKQYESETANKPPPSPKRQLTPDRTGKVEYVNEPHGFLEKYEPQTESGVYENQPEAKTEVVKCGEQTEEYVPEAGTAKKTLERFKEIQNQSSSPVQSSKPRQSFTPPRELSPGRNVSGVSENEPEARPDVVRGGEVVEDVRPEQGSARNILNKFKEIQSGSSSPASPTKKPKEFTPPPESGVYENKPDDSLKVENDKLSFSGVLENQPTKSEADVPVTREPLAPEQEIPESGMAKNLVSKFRQLETSAGASKSASPRFKEFTPPRDSRGPLSPKSPAGAQTNGVHPTDLPGQYQQQDGATIHENEPEKKPDVYREADTDWGEGLPKANTTSSMLERFKSMQKKAVDDQKTPAPISRKDESHTISQAQDSEAKGMFKVVQTEKCAACDKTVYAMEKLEMNGHIYHRNCFKCSHCSARLTPKTFSMNEGVIYCITHFKQLFARKGNYDEGFGRLQYKKKWGEKGDGATA